jgi:uncharacterized damage-inducible protein DinB
MTPAQPYLTEIQRLLERLCGAIDGLSEEQLNWKPPIPDGNSIFVIATHTLGNVEAWVLGIACEHPIERDRAAEFRSTGSSAAPLIERAHELAQQLAQALNRLSAGDLDRIREASQSHWGVGVTRSITGREALLHVIGHAANHLGHIEVTRDLALAR